MGVEKSFSHVGKGMRNFVLGIGIFILTMFVVVYGVNTFLDKPEYEDYCPSVYDVSEESVCLERGGVWNDVEIVGNEAVPTSKRNCANQVDCRDGYNDAMEKRSKIIFIISIPLALLIIALGMFIFNLNSVGVGLMFGGIGTLIYGAGGYWRYSQDLLKFVMSLVALGILIWVGYRFEQKK